MNNPLASIGPPKEWAERAQAAIDEGRKIGAKTARERDYIEAVAAYYDDWANRPERTRQQNRAQALEAPAARYPPDHHAPIFSAPSIAPSAPHALHRPSHIFARGGLWTESAETNVRSAASARRDGDGDEQAHAMDYMVYAYLQLARDTDARRVVDERGQVARYVRFAGPYALAAIPARYAVERGDWAAATQLQPTPGALPFAEALTHFARGLGAARTGDAAGAEKEGLELARRRDALKAAK